jgi:hypothetical protein
MTMRITNDCPIRHIAGSIVFEAEDAGGPFELWVAGLLWERLQAEAPIPGDGDDRRDYALSMLEATAADATPSIANSGLRVLIL